MKKFIRLYKLIAQNQRLSEKRHPMFDKNRAMKIFTYIMAAFWACYLIFFGCMFGSMLKGANSEACDIINSGFIFFMILDFFMRFPMQETPAQEVKPYKLLPIPTNFLMDVFLYRIALKPYNLIWLFFFVPFGVLSVALLPYFGMWAFVGYILGVWLMFVLNSYGYLLWRTLTNRHMLYILIPIAIYAALITFGMVVNQWLFDALMRFMRGFIEWNPLCFLAVIAAIVVLFFINRIVQKRFIYYEISRVDKVKNVKSNEMTYLNRYGVIGEYLKLEIKSVMRNNVVRKQFLIGLGCTIMLSCLCAFTPAYDSGFMHVFILVYCFAAGGIISLTNVMGLEGNYIDGLMSRKESVLALLKAKYYFNCAMMLVPTLIMIAPAVTGKFSLIELAGCLLFTPGCIFPFIFILAIYNNTTLDPVNKMTQRPTNTKAQMLVSFASMFVPMGIMYALVSLLDKNTAGLIMMLMGLAGTLASTVWLKQIYKHFMIHRYENMSSFRATRQS